MKVDLKKRPLKVRRIADLKPYEKNARTHSEAQIDQLCASLQEFGWTNPILVDGENMVIAGHARLEAARKLGMKEVPTIALADLTEAQRKAYIIADNKLALNAGWDEPLLGAELMELDSVGFDCELTGFSGIELEGLFARANGEIVEDPEREWEGMPEFQQEHLLGVRTIIMHFPDEESVKEFAGLLGQSVTEKTKYLWFPEQATESRRSRVYSSES